MDRNYIEANTNILATLGRNLRAGRLSAGLTQQELAARAGIALAIFAQVESGCSDPGRDLLGTLAKAVGRAAYDLVNR